MTVEACSNINFCIDNSLSDSTCCMKKEKPKCFAEKITHFFERIKGNLWSRMNRGAGVEKLLRLLRSPSVHTPIFWTKSSFKQSLLMMHQVWHDTVYD